MARPPIGLLVVRAWMEAGSPDPLRATIRLTTDTAGGFTSELHLSDADAVTDVVRAWLQDILAGADPVT